MTIKLLLILVIILTAPFLSKRIEKNLEFFLFIMGIAAASAAAVLTFKLISEILHNPFLYFITGAVLLSSILFRVFVRQLRSAIRTLLIFLPLPVFSFLLVLLLGLFSSLISAIVAALVLVEVVQHMPVNRDKKVVLTVVSCFAVGMGAILTPVGEPLSTIVVSVMNADFSYLFRLLGIYVTPALLFLAFIAAFLTRSNHLRRRDEDRVTLYESKKHDIEPVSFILIRTAKIFVFVIALDLLGSGFKPLIEIFLLEIPSAFLYWINILSAVLDNATIAAAEISPMMTQHQITAILIGLLISGGILIPGNIPNIIAASKLQITSQEWLRVGAPLGFLLLVIYFIILFIL